MFIYKRDIEAGENYVRCSFDDASHRYYVLTWEGDPNFVTAFIDGKPIYEIRDDGLIIDSEGTVLALFECIEYRSGNDEKMNRILIATNAKNITPPEKGTVENVRPETLKSWDLIFSI